MAEYVVKGAEPGETVLHGWTPNGYEEWSWLPVLERIVRCRDCIHATPDTSGRKRYKGYLWCDKMTEGIGLSVAPSGFCAWGERKEVDA